MTVTSSGYDRQKNDLYETEEWATEALLRHLPKIHAWCIWEPSNGNGKISSVLERHGAFCFKTDIQDYEQENIYFDFLNQSGFTIAGKPHAIITNPPYGKGNRHAVKYAELALDLCDGYVALLLTAKFDFGKTRQHLFKNNSRYFGKIALLDRIQWFEGATTGTEDHAWYIWGPGSYIQKLNFWESK